ncbi:hypothetical protein GSI_05808 [Ganoderma sinense ZZ0214-1]|uniref:Uncharacterized protein n=1 Tax=Ganoderma sinense ZZ0214-1 TaxID=1077348 RepID=A0A2G8SBJ9_9APHY|nr:hypothetical protein GSI_05808 [Ganoderma sinense ZZ0214-1]
MDGRHAARAELHPSTKPVSKFTNASLRAARPASFQDPAAASRYGVLVLSLVLAFVLSLSRGVAQHSSISKVREESPIGGGCGRGGDGIPPPCEFEARAIAFSGFEQRRAASPGPPGLPAGGEAGQGTAGTGGTSNEEQLCKDRSRSPLNVN